MKTNRMGYYTARMLPDGSVLSVVSLTFGRARILLSLPRWRWVTVEDSW